MTWPMTGQTTEDSGKNGDEPLARAVADELPQGAKPPPDADSARRLAFEKEALRGRLAADRRRDTFGLVIVLVTLGASVGLAVIGQAQMAGLMLVAAGLAGAAMMVSAWLRLAGRGRG
jgi:hypothetical protein